jgi:hypothetical protein
VVNSSQKGESDHGNDHRLLPTLWKQRFGT